MKNLLGVVSAVWALFFICSCASAPLPPPQYSYGKGEIHLEIKAEPRLNTYGGSSHTLLLCVYQLKDPNAFNQLTGDEDGLYKLLECGHFDSSVTNATRLIIRPGETRTIKLDRAEGTRYVGLVAGYSVLKEQNMIRLFKIPVIIETKGLISRTKIAKPGLLDLELLLGPHQIKEATSSKSNGKKE